MKRTPTLKEVIDAGMDGRLANLHTAMPATVVSYDAAKGTATVQPAYKRRYADQDDAVDLPLIPAVPVMVLGTANTWIRFPVAKGDTVLLVFAERSLDRWLERGGQVDPNDTRRHSLKDAVAIPGLRPGQAPQARGAADSVELVHGRARLELTKDGKVKLGNDFVELLSLLNDILSHLQNLTTTNAAIGVPCALSPASIAQLLADQQKLLQLKA